jgi:DUF1009 family protein
MTDNKFLKQYPQLWFPKVGDKIRIIRLLDMDKTEIQKWHYNKNEVGKIQYIYKNREGWDVYDIVFCSGKVEPVYREEFELAYDE